MSVFDQNNNQSTAQNLLETLVGDGQKYKTAEELAKGYQNADAHIATLTQELQELKAQQTSSQNITDAVNSKKDSQDEVTNGTPANLNSLSKDELINLMKNVMNEDKTHNVQKTNLSQVDEFLINKFGDKAPEEAARIAEANGMTIAQLKDLSVASPQAVINLCGGIGQAPNQTSTFTSSINTASQTETVKGNSYFSKLRKDDPKAFYSRAVQDEMRNAIASLGEDFINS